MISVKDITKTYITGSIETQALKGVSFEVQKGEFVAIMGPSGSGKSTLMHILGALDSPTLGTYKLDGKDVSELSEDELADIRAEKIGFVFQTFNLLPRATVMRNVMLPLIYTNVDVKEREERSKQALRAVGLAEDRWQHHSNEISGGQKQRVAIARALVNDPTIILADEPTGNLDSKTGNLVLSTFQKLNREKKHTIVLITHEREIAEYADRIIYIKDGKVESDTKNGTKKREAITPKNI